jgi:hypothetical protein
MIVYKDILSGDEMLSSAFPLMEVKDADGNVVSISADESALRPYATQKRTTSTIFCAFFLYFCTLHPFLLRID